MQKSAFVFEKANIAAIVVPSKKVIFSSFVASVGYVDVSADTKDAKVQIIFTEDAVSQQILSSTIKSKIGKQTELRITPRLKFDFSKIQNFIYIMKKKLQIR